jgi:UDPglucose--hexose-1-phosphate uridylyltransferase
VLLKYDGLWRRPMPYLMCWFQAASDGEPHPEAHLHAQLWPPYRTPERLKFLAGTELGAGFYAMDALPEDKARELQAIEVTLS